MKLDMTFEESNQRIELNFAEVQQASDGGFERGYEQGYTEGNENGYKDGYFEGQEETASLFGIPNEVKGTNIVTLDYVNENVHNVEVKLSSDTVTDFSGVEVIAQGTNYFDISKFVSNPQAKNNGDGTITLKDYAGDNSNKLTECFPNIRVGQVIKISTKPQLTFLVFGNELKQIDTYQSITITQEMLDANKFGFYAKANTTPDNPLVISDIMASEDILLPYEPYTEKTYTANADGTVDGVTSISPTMNIICDTEGVNIHAKYYCAPDVEWNRFWDVFQARGTRKVYNYAFAYSGWNDSNYKPKYIVKPTTAEYMFLKSEITNIEEIDLSICKSIIGMFSTSKIKNVDCLDLKNFTTVSRLFEDSEVESVELKNVQETLVWTVFDFNGCVKLKNLKMNGVIGRGLTLQWCKLLSVESAKNIIQCLANLIDTNPFKYTLTLHVNVWNALAEEGNTSPNNNSWEDYLVDIGWNKG